MNLKAAVLLLWGLAGCLPNVQSVKERRASFPREAFAGSLILADPPADLKPVGAVFGKRAKLLGYRMEPNEPKPGASVTITFYWQALRAMAEEYKVFVHGDAVGEKRARIHGDHFPAQGKYPTDVWQTSEVVLDRFRIRIPPGYSARQLGIFVGLYKGDYRVPLTSAGQRPKTSDNRSRSIDIFF